MRKPTHDLRILDAINKTSYFGSGVANQGRRRFVLSFEFLWMRIHQPIFKGKLCN